MPDLDMPDWRNPASGSRMVWDPTAQRYVEQDSDGENQPTTWQGAGQTLDPAIHTVRPKNPDQTGILASWIPSEGDQVSFRGNESGIGAGMPNYGDVATVLSIREDSRGGYMALIELPARNGGSYRQWWNTEHLIPKDDADRLLDDKMHVPVDFQRSVNDSANQVEHMVTHASLDPDNTTTFIISADYKQHIEQMVRNASVCPNCSGDIDADGVCEKCHYQQFDVHQHQHSRADLGPFPERVPKQNYLQTDPSYPSLASAPKSLTSEMRSFPESESSWEHDLREAGDASLDKCPECHSTMTEGKHGAKCDECGLKQPAVALSSHNKLAWAFLAPLAGAAARILGMGAARAGAGAMAGEAAGAGGAAAAGGTATGGGLMGGVGSIMNMVKANPIASANVGMNLMNGGDQAATQPAPVAQPQQPIVNIASRTAGPDSNESWQVEFVSRGDSDNPENDGEQGFLQKHKDSPEFLKDVNDVGGTKTEGDSDVPPEWMEELHSMTEDQKSALDLLGKNLDHIIMLVESEEDGSNDEVFKSVDEALEAAFPGYKAESEKDKKEPKVSSHEYLEKIAARRPKLCPAHSDLIDASLLEGKSLLGQFAPANYGSNYCKSPDFDSKCNFKPAMTTQKFWDDKEEAALQRKQEREQAAQSELEAQRAEELEGTTLDPAEHDVDFGDPPAGETAVTEISEYAPGLSEAPSAIGQPVAASFSGVDIGTAVRRRSLNPSHDDPVGVVVEMTTVHPSSPGRATVRFEGGHEESIPVADLEPADGGGIDHPTLDHAVDAPYSDPDTADAYNMMGDQLTGESGGNPYSYASVKQSEHSESDTLHVEDADQFDFGHGAPAHQSDSAVADDGQSEVGVKDVNGHPLREGSTYLMASEDYSVPDKVTIDKVAGTDVTYTIHTGQMDFQDTMSVADMELQKLTFKPVGDSSAEGSPEDLSDDTPVPTEHQGEDDGGNLSDFKAASRTEGCTCDEDLCECEKKTSSYEVPGRASAPDEHFMWSAEPSQKTAGKDYSSRELRELISEGEGKLARNFDSLDLSGTHYLNDTSDTDDWLW